MHISSLLLNERERLAALKEYQILDTEPEQEYNEIVELASQICDTPIALITFLDEKRQWFKAKIGIDINETHRDVSFCSHAIHGNTIMQVPDASKDKRFVDNPFVRDDPGIRFYAGVPLVTGSALKLGALCVIDYKPRTLNDHQLNALRILGKQVVRLLELRAHTSALSTDVEERMAEIKARENTMTLIMKSSLDAIICMDKNGLITFWNPQAEKKFGWKRKDVLGKHLVDTIIPPQYREAHLKGLEHYLATGEGPVLNTILEISALNRKGEEFPIELTIAPIKEDHHEFFCAFIRNITERKQAEAALSDARQRYQSIFQNAFEGIFQTTPEGRFVTVNPSMASIFGYDSPQELVTSVTDISQLYLKPTTQPELMNLLEKETRVVGYEFAAIKKNKNPIWIRANIRTIYDSEGKLKYFEGTLKDITEQKQVQVQLIREKEFAESFINSLPGVFYMYNMEGKFLRWNKNFETVTGYSSEEIAAMHPSQFFLEGTERDLVVSKIGEVFTKGFAQVEANFLLKDKTAIPYYFNGWKIDYENETCLIGVGLDISERKKGEEKLKTQFEELQTANHELDRFVYSVSHDLRAPLSSILGIINLAEIEDFKSPAITNYLGIIRNSINKLDGFIKDILDYSYNSRQALTIDKIHFQSILNEVQSNLKYLHGSDRLKISFEIEGPAIFYSDRTRIAILINNLLSNAIRYQDFKKESSLLYIHLVTSPENVMIRFSDNGIGIEAEHINKIFDIFYRASHYSKGSGLGLYITKQALLKLGGTIKAESVFGLSTTFEINLPCQPPQ